MDEVIQRIPNYYVSDDCAQVMIGHDRNGITIFNEDNIIFHFKPNSTHFVNKYFRDERKNKFPYSQIPSHMGKIKGRKVEFINQLFDFNKVYLTITNRSLIENFVLKDGDEALLATKCITPELESKQYMTKEDIEEYLKRDNIINIYNPKDGGIYLKSCIFMRDKSKILDDFKNELNYNGKSKITGAYWYEDNDTYYYTYSLESLTPDKIPSSFIKPERFIIVSRDLDNLDNNIKIKYLYIKYDPINDLYMVDNYLCPYTVYTLEHMKYLESIKCKKIKEPKFSKRLNPNIDKTYLHQEKEHILKRTKKR